MQIARRVARGVAWLFVADIAYHAVLAAQKAVHAATHSNWSYAVEMTAIAIVAAALVVGAAVTEVKVRRR